MLTITDAAVAAVKSAILQEGLPEGTCLRVLVKSGGCSGLSYAMAFEDSPAEGDRTIEQDGVRLLLDARSELYLAGTILDFTSGLNGQGFVFNNPAAAGTCGCGKSFSA
jgi:iron-sulfur cluster assembly protein